ncbi:hypothetical protein ACP70R_020613 [Stipagrostis hirtigluma subsp. patula]
MAPGEDNALYEIRRHASGSHVIPHQGHEDAGTSGGSSGAGGGGVLPYLSLQGVSKLRERFSSYTILGRSRGRRRGNSVSLFVSQAAEYVAVTVGNHITILRKGDGYTLPCGVYTNNDRMTFFTNGVWLEAQGIFSVVDDLSTLYLIKENGELLARRTCDQLKLSSPIIDLFVWDGSSLQRPGFYILSSDCTIHRFDYTHEPEASLSNIPISTKDVTSARTLQLPRSLSCMDYHQHHSLLVLVADSNVSCSSNGFSGTYFLYVLRFDGNLQLSLSFRSLQLEGVFSPPKDRTTLVSSPKIRISPQAKHIATLDLTGTVNLFAIDDDTCTVSLHPLGSRYLIDVKDISWWTDDILIVVREDGSINMYSITENKVVSKDDPVLSTPLVEKAKVTEGHVFILQSSRQERNSDSDPNLASGSGDHQQTEMDKMFWSLISFSKVTVTEMYSVLIRENRYEEALDFASRYNLDKDEVLKARWLDSNGDIHEIDTYLANIKDQVFVLSECVNKVGPTEAALRALLSFGLRITEHYKFLELDNGSEGSAWDSRIVRLRLLWHRDMLETFLGINMGRYSAGEYSKFRSIPLVQTAIALAESGKIGALNLIFKRHPYTISSDILRILSAIPETVAVQTYSQLLPGKSPPSIVILRDGDWVECKQMVSYINNCRAQLDKIGEIKTEILVKHSAGFSWPSVAELCDWYKNRARDIDCLSGQLENCLSMIELACQKGIAELQSFLDDIKCLYQVVYSNELNEFIMNLVTWGGLPDYEKFKIILKGVREETVVQRLEENAIPFMRKRFHISSDNDGKEESYLVRWLKEVAAENELSICLAVIENGCGESPIHGLFKDLCEMIETAVHCIYVCAATNQWNTMSTILSKLLHKTKREKSLLASEEDFSLKDSKQALSTSVVSYDEMQRVCADILSGLGNCHEDFYHYDSIPYELNNANYLVILEKRLKVAEGHVEVGRLFAYYQVPKPTHFFLSAHLDEKNVKQLIRLLLSKFGRRQPARSDIEWANMWRDLKLFQEKAFPFLDSEYMLAEFIRGLLKAGKFSLARNYLGGTSAVSLSTEKAENLVIQAAREYFFSASTLSGNEIWKARECLNLLPNNKNVQAETDIIDALTVRLPYLGVTILPVQFRQVKDPMEIIRMVISSQTGAYLHVEEIIDVAKLLGLRSEEEIAAVEEAIAREAVVNGDLQLAFDICLNLTKKGHSAVWDLCAAIARGPPLDNLDTGTREKLLGFSLSHCDEESVGELLNAWKELDVHDKFEQLMIATGTNPPNFMIDGSSVTPLPVQSMQDILDLRDDNSHDRDKDHMEIVKEMLSKVCMDLPDEDVHKWDSMLAGNRKFLSFCALELPWLLKLSDDEQQNGENQTSTTHRSTRRYRFSTKVEATVSIVYWLAVNGFAPNDNLITILAKSIMEPPVDEEYDILGCSVLLNLMDPFNGVKIIEEELKKRECYQEISSIMNIGMLYSSLNNAKKECSTPEQRRDLLLHKFHEKLTSVDSDDLDQVDMAHTTFWREWKSKLEEEKQLADQARMLKQILPDIDTSRFLSGDANYIRKVVFSFVDSVKQEKKHVLKEAVKIAETYGLQRTEVLLRFLCCSLVSEHWDNNDILSEISEFREDIVRSAKGVIDMIYSDVYPEINGYNKQRLSYIYGILSACHSYLKRTSEIELRYAEHVHTHKLEPFQYYKVLEEECKKVSFIDGLNYKNIAGLDNLNFEHFNEEVCKNIDASTVSALADMVQALVSMYIDVLAKGLISRQGVYKHYVLGLLASLEGRSEARSNCTDYQKLQAVLCEIELNYDSCREYIQALPSTDISYIVGRYCTLCFPSNLARSHPHEPSWKKPLATLVTFWTKLVDDIPGESIDACSYERTNHLNSNRLSHCMRTFRQLLINDDITVHQGWDAISLYVKFGLSSGMMMDTSYFCRAMILSGCAFECVVNVYYGGQGQLGCESADSNNPLDLLELYNATTDECLSDLIEGSCEFQVSLHKLLSSLSRSTGKHVGTLEMIRSGVWGKLISFSENMQLESQLRVYALQLMQCITGKNLNTLPNEMVSQVEPWELWFEHGAGDAIADESINASSSITGTLVALRSTQMVTAVLPDANITPENLATLDSAVSCFLQLSERTSSVESVAVLEAVLEEWEQLFCPKEEYVPPHESPKETSDWSDGWDDGWDALPEELESPKNNKQVGASLSVHPLHSCWMEIIKKLAGLGELQKVIKLLDRASSKHSLYLEEEEAHHVLELVSALDCFMALKIFLLLPYEAPRLQCLKMVEVKMREGTVSTSSNADDHELLALVLSSGTMQMITTDEAYSKFFSYLCHLVGHLARSFQVDLLIRWNEANTPNTSKMYGSLLFGRVLFPCFISELVLRGQYLLAGFIISRCMHTHPSLGLMDIIEASVRRFLEGQVAQAQDLGGSDSSFTDNELSVRHTISTLQSKLASLLQAALGALPKQEL